MDLHKPVFIGNRTMDELTVEEKLRLDHQNLHEQHKGHEKMHAEMVFILILTLIVAQVVLIEWKKRHYRSYSIVTLIGMWMVPFILCLKNRWWRFIFIWLLFSCMTGLIFRKAVQKPLDRTTPRLVYKWFLLLYKLSYGLGIIGYIVMMSVFFGLNLVFNTAANIWMDVSMLFIFYGLYYGVLGRDISEICADKMASHIGYYSPQGMPTKNLDPNVCAICGNRLLVTEDEEGVIENTYKLSCEHVFHEFCIRGWCIVGKKQTCPYCKEKVELKQIFSNPWEKPHMLYGQLLDWIRWLVAWQPMVFFLVRGINWILGLE
ncbi:E3 ubiquitin ligase Rnf121 [Cylas formicarius]|uniref:E3 ubiquitin ligase Rnf121 n=1 Tax=Cylas formicarius TaxID=197179 RepID=UPI002958795E|nr:E3 ubiquitin ligase Rnf121 [Cylas formicarius]XP_060532450.1 E3 ubiquitin ligase Rnf121 [Cylas formicarius]